MNSLVRGDEEDAVANLRYSLQDSQRQFQDRHASYEI